MIIVDVAAVVFVVVVVVVVTIITILPTIKSLTELFGFVKRRRSAASVYKTRVVLPTAAKPHPRLHRARRDENFPSC